MPPAGDPYRALGVARGATAAEIKRAHRRLAKRFHPDTSEGDARRFLVIQEAYRVLSDPLLRRDWDARHAAGPVRATDTPKKKAPTSRAQPAPPRPPRQPRPGEHRTDTADHAPPSGAQPRSSRSYTWSASEVPWWEEGIKHNAAKRATRRARAGAEPAEERAAVADFEVFNRSSGAAWSMAARAYFRKGDADLPSRGVFRQQSGQPLTGGKARAAAEAERRVGPADAAPDEKAKGGGEVRPGRGER